MSYEERKLFELSKEQISHDRGHNKGRVYAFSGNNEAMTLNEHI